MGVGSMLKFCLCVLVALLVSPVSRAMADTNISVKKIQIITPHWEGQTNLDGSGLLFEIVQQVYNPMGIKVTHGFAPWKQCKDMVNLQNLDAMLCVFSKDAQRENQLIPRYPLYVEQTAVVFKRASIPYWQGIHTLDLKRAVWREGVDYHAQKQLRSILFSQWHEVDTPEKAWHLLNTDQAEVYLDTLMGLESYIKRHFIDMGLYQKQILWKQESYIAFSNSHTSRELIQIFDGQIQKLFRSGKLEKIYQKWNHPFFPEYWQDQNTDKTKILTK